MHLFVREDSSHKFPIWKKTHTNRGGVGHFGRHGTKTFEKTRTDDDSKVFFRGAEQKRS